MRLLLLLGLLVLTGCSSTVELPVMSKEDIQLLNKGTIFTAPKDGAFVSDEYMHEVMKIRIGE